MNRASGAGEGLDTLIAAVMPMKYVIPFIALVCLIAPDLFKDGFQLELMPLLGLGIASGMFLPMWRYQHHQSSVRGLLLALDAGLFSVGAVLLLGTVNLARSFAANYWLYRDYAYVYAAVFLGTVFYVVFGPLKAVANIRQQVMTLAAYIDTGITSAELYDTLTMPKGSKEAIETWNSQRFALILGPIGVGCVVAGAIGGGDYILYVCFLGVLVLAPFMAALGVVRRVFIMKYLGTNDVLILDRWKHDA